MSNAAYASRALQDGSQCAHRETTEDQAIACARSRGVSFITTPFGTTKGVFRLHTARCREAYACGHHAATCVCAEEVCRECGAPVEWDAEGAECSRHCSSRLVAS